MLDGVEIMGTSADNPADMVWAQPAITVTGFTSTPVSEAVNAVPATASAKLNLRVPPGMDASEVAAAVTKHLRSHVPWNVRLSVQVSDVNNPFSSNIEGPAVTTFIQCLRGAYVRLYSEIKTDDGEILTTKQIGPRLRGGLCRV